MSDMPPSAPPDLAHILLHQFGQGYDSSPLRLWRPEPFAPRPGEYFPPFGRIDRQPDSIGIEYHPTSRAIQDIAKHLERLRTTTTQVEGRRKVLSSEEYARKRAELMGELDPPTPDWAPWLKGAMPSVSRMPEYNPNNRAPLEGHDKSFQLKNRVWPGLRDEPPGWRGGAAGSASELRWFEDALNRFRMR